MADTEEQERADRRFEEALERTGARDPRAVYRTLLKELKSQSEERYRETVGRWRSEVVEPLADGEAEPLERWLRFGAELARDLHPGRTVVVDEAGRAAPHRGTPSWRELVLHLPDAKRVRAIPVSLPPEPSPAQQATVDLLVEGRVKLPGA